MNEETILAIPEARFVSSAIAGFMRTGAELKCLLVPHGGVIKRTGAEKTVEIADVNAGVANFS